MSAHSSGSKWDAFICTKHMNYRDIYCKIPHEIEKQNQHKSNQVDKFCSWKQPRLDLDCFLSMPTTSYTYEMNGIHIWPLKVTHHSDEIDGTLKTPQWMKMPTLLSSYHAGNGRESIDAQSGVYCCSVNGKREQQRTARKTAVARECILLIFKTDPQMKSTRWSDEFIKARIFSSQERMREIR